MAVGLGRLGLSPRAFWAATPRELAAAMTPLAAATPEPATRRALDDLMQRYPDARSDPDAGR